MLSIEISGKHPFIQSLIFKTTPQKDIWEAGARQIAFSWVSGIYHYLREIAKITNQSLLICGSQISLI